MKSQKLWIGGKWVDAESGKTFAVLNPSTEKELGRVALGGKADVDKAVQAAVKAFPVWSKMLQSERARLVSKFTDTIRENADDLISLEVREHVVKIIVRFR
jgi:acyl-CoA reductase-like NAD-dependent aldehyde dehydrogenase